MLAHHPVTGKEVRIIHSDASLWKEKKTLYWSKTNVITPWDSVSIGPELNSCNYRILLEQIEGDLLEKLSGQCRLLFVAKKAISHLQGSKIGIRNIICLEEMETIYPHLGPVWDGSELDALVLVAGLLSYRLLAGVDEINERAKKLEIAREANPPARLWWVTQYYSPDKAKRKREIDTCLLHNVQSPLIDKVILLNEKKETLPDAVKDSNKLEERVVGSRLTYQQVLCEAAKTFPDDVILCFANADICIDSASWHSLWSVNLTNRCLALLRWDVGEVGKEESGAELFGPRPDSQDSWVVRVADLKSRPESSWTPMNFPFGKMGCDNAFAIEMFKQRFVVVNPARSLKTFHYHRSGLRNYEKTDIVEKPAFLYIHPTGFHDLEPCMTRLESIPGLATTLQKPTTLQRIVRGSGAKEWVEKMNRLEVSQSSQYTWSTESTNPITPSPEVILHMKQCMQNENGLCYDRRRMYVGAGMKAQRFWSEHPLHSLAPSVVCSKGFIVPCEESTMQSREEYVLKYLSRIFRLRSTGAIGEFYCPEKKEITDLLQMFTWNAASTPVIRYEKEMQVFFEEAEVFSVSENTDILAEDIDALRKNVKGWIDHVQNENGRPRIVIFQDDKIINDDIVYALEDVLEKAWEVKVVYPGRTSSERFWDTLRGAWGVIVASGTYKNIGWNWLLPKGAMVFEVQGSTAPNALGLQISAAAGLDHRIVKPIEKAKGVEHIFDEIWEEGVMTGVIDSVKGGDGAKPIVYLPRRDLEGYFAHAGDSFREMARLWGQKGYVQVKEHPTATMCWWSSVGNEGTLLYDRPTHDWRLAAPLAERQPRFALYGNPKPPAGTPASSWFFWPRRPALVEELVEQGAANRSWSERRSGPVFYGKIENKVQEKRRTNADWKAACSESGGEWILVSGADTPYPFTAKEYLEKLASARFGLCLAGYGFKCHREVECLAMGCVPLVAPECDMSSYADPLVEGVHYLVVKTPEEAVEKAKNTSEKDWKKLSDAGQAWWKKNCSCEGSFLLTKKLIEANYQGSK